MTEHSQHTPGPWIVEGDGIKALVRGADAAIVAVRHLLPRSVHEANARLIAAAPDMLAALKLVDEMGKAEERDGDDALWTPQFREMFETARTAIAKATGVNT